MTIEERLAEREQRRKTDQQFREKLIDEIATEYDFGLAIAKACVDKGWKDSFRCSFSYYWTILDCGRISFW